MVQLRVYFQSYSKYFDMDQNKAMYLLQMCEGENIQPWAYGILESLEEQYPNSLLDDFGSLVKEAQRLWGPLDSKADAQQRLERLRQTMTVADYYASFMKEAPLTGYNDMALVNQFY